MSLFERIAFVTKANLNSFKTNQSLSISQKNYKHFLGTLSLEFDVDEFYRELILNVFKSNVQLQIGVQLTSANFIAYRQQNNVNGFVLECEYNSINEADVTSAPKHLYAYNQTSENEAQILRDYIDSQYKTRGIDKSQAEGELCATILSCSNIFLVDFVLDIILKHLQDLANQGYDISDFPLPLPYPIDNICKATDEDFDFNYHINMNGVNMYAEELNVPVYPPFSRAMQPARGAIIQFFRDKGLEDWDSFLTQVFQTASNDYISQNP
jgi:hypothetical protein